LQKTPKNQNFKGEKVKNPVKPPLPAQIFAKKNTTDRKKYNFSESKYPTPPRGHTFFLQKKESGPFKKTIAWHFEHHKAITSKRKQTNYNKIYCKLIFYKNISFSLQALYFIQIQRFSNKKLQISKVSIRFQQTKKVLYFIQ